MTGEGEANFDSAFDALSDTLKMARNLVRQGGRPSLTRRAVATASLHSSTWSSAVREAWA